MNVEDSSVGKRAVSLHSSQEQAAMLLVQLQAWKPQSIKEEWADSVRYFIKILICNVLVTNFAQLLHDFVILTILRV